MHRCFTHIPLRKMQWSTYELHRIMNSIGQDDDECQVKADLENITVEQYVFNEWMKQLEERGDGFKTGFKTKNEGPFPIKLSWLKCWFWWLLPEKVLGTRRHFFSRWKIGHCLNCDASPYDGQVEAWSYDSHWHKGALIRCGKCGQLRWQHRM